jgi:asparagine synthase (glutamine-hydrolysing)
MVPFSGCGIAGALALGGGSAPPPLSATVFDGMVDTLRHRGPHGRGVFHDGPVRLGHRRLSILDLSERGAQPMSRGHLAITYNGEVYNFAAIRADLEAEGITFTSGTDTEVILHALDRWGELALHRFNGMFAFALWDQRDHSLLLVRDRLGVKPLYYWCDGKTLLFASEVEAILASGLVPPTIDEGALAEQLLATSFHAPDRTRTLVEGVRSLLPGHLLRVSADGKMAGWEWWRIPSRDPGAERAPDPREFLALLDDSVQLRLVSDVPVAAFLSGGMDSSTINALAARVPGRPPLQSLTLAFAGGGKDRYSEARDTDPEYTAMVVAALGDKLRHRTVAIEARGLEIAAIDELIDFASLPDDWRLLDIAANYRAVAGCDLRVVLNGQGADETQGGYMAIWQHLLAGQPRSVRTMLDQHTRESAPHLAPALAAQREEVTRRVEALHDSLPGEDALERLHRFLVATQLGRILRFEDILSMRASVECRLPFLDYRVVSWAFQVPFSAHLRERDQRGKMLLRRACQGLLPEAVLERPKQAFPDANEAARAEAVVRLCRVHQQELRGSPLVGGALRPELLDGIAAGVPPRMGWMMLVLWRLEERMKRAARPDHGR